MAKNSELLTSLESNSTLEAITLLDLENAQSDFEVNWLYQPTNKRIRNEYEEFIGNNRSLLSEIILIFVMFLFDILLVLLPAPSSKASVRALQFTFYPIFIVKLLVASICAAELYLRASSSSCKVLAFIRKYKAALNSFYILSWTTEVCLVFLAQTLSDACTENAKVFRGNFCRPNHDMNDIPRTTGLLLALMPLMAITMLRESRASVTAVVWLMVFATLITGLVIVESPSALSINFCIIFFIATLLMMHDIFRQNLAKFKLMRSLQASLRENKILRAQERATEMRHLIANVAHDLKTPLSSFMVGVEFIENIIQDCLDSSVGSDIDEGSSSNGKSGSGKSGSGKSGSGKSGKIEGVLSVAKLRSASDSIKSCLHDIYSTNSFMIMAINRCLDYTKASKGVKLHPKNETISLLETLQMPLACMQNVRQETTINLLPVPREICSHIITDKQWLQENILCLLSNAVKYSPLGSEVTVEVSLENQRADTDSDTAVTETATIAGGEASKRLPFASISTVSNESKNEQEAPQESLIVTDGATVTQELRFNVQDMGIGVSEEAMVNLFNPFQQAQRMAGGTGLGLFSLAKRIEALGGRYNVSKRSDGKQGSLFWFTIPYRPDSTAALCEHSRLPPNKQSGPELMLLGPSSAPTNDQDVVSAKSSLKGIRILVVDDSPPIRKLMGMTLQRQGHAVVMARDGAEALKMVQESKSNERYDAILMDLQMPIMDGLESIRRIRDLEKTSVERGEPEQEPERIIGLSANSDRETMAEALSNGADAFMEKPFKMEVFYELMRSQFQIAI